MERNLSAPIATRWLGRGREGEILGVSGGGAVGELWVCSRRILEQNTLRPLNDRGMMVAGGVFSRFFVEFIFYISRE